MTAHVLLRIAALLATAAPAALAQDRAAVERDRADYAQWLATAPESPLAAIARQPVGQRVTLGPGSDIPLEGIGAHTLARSGAAIELTGPSGRRMVPRDRAVPLGSYRLVVSGSAERPVVTVFGKPAAKAPAWFAYDPAFVFERPLQPPRTPGRVRLLAPDGSEVEATEAGVVTVPVGGREVPLLVRRIPVPGTEESELEVFFRDATGGAETYPPGRFVTLVPVAGGRVRVDFNRARNPFCAYNGVYPCPLPWAGNAIPARVTAGETYTPAAGSAR